MLRLVYDLHAAVSQPYLIDANYNTVNTPTAAGVSFQTWWGGPYKIVSDSSTAQKTVTIYFASSGSVPNLTGKRLIVATHGIEGAIVSNTTADPHNVVLTLTNNLSASISNTSTYNIACFITDRTSYCVVNNSLVFSNSTANAILGSGVTNATPFSIPVGAGGASTSGVVSAANLSTADPKTSNRNFKSANILLNQQVPSKAKLTTYE